ncbi:hypothetical protein [Burkholderia ubonensis]|uniref:hypothetical protein n=1 Tax=Burkholderia ubonensis TaxID=101571 RepID=UPI0012F82255|nr:hypothetical protein [Burkholderia ubonensis]
MPLLQEEIVPGAVAILDVTVLLAQPGIESAEANVRFRTGPFLCVQVKDDKALWINITKQRDTRGLRLELKDEWRLEGSDIWQKEPQFVHDARKSFIAPLQAFVRAGAHELPHQPHKRPCVSNEGVSAVLAELGKYRAPVL